jgi:hypothetical protein
MKTMIVTARARLLSEGVREEKRRELLSRNDPDQTNMNKSALAIT